MFDKSDIVLTKNECLNLLQFADKTGKNKTLDSAINNAKDDQEATYILNQVITAPVDLLRAVKSEFEINSWKRDKIKYLSILCENRKVFTPDVIKYIVKQQIEAIYYLYGVNDVKHRSIPKTNNGFELSSTYNCPQCETLTRPELLEECVKIATIEGVLSLTEDEMEELRDKKFLEMVGYTNQALEVFYDSYRPFDLRELVKNNTREVTVNEESQEHEYSGGNLLDRFDIEQNGLELDSDSHDLTEMVDNLFNDFQIYLNDKNDAKSLGEFENLAEEIYAITVLDNSKLNRYIGREQIEEINENIAHACTLKLYEFKDMVFESESPRLTNYINSESDRVGFSGLVLEFDEEFVEINEYEDVLTAFEFSKDKIIAFKNTYIDVSLENAVNVYIIIQEIKNTINTELIDCLVSNLPESITSLRYKTEDSKKSFQEMLEAANFNTSQLIMLCDCHEFLGETAVFDLFNKSEVHMIKTDINTLIKLKNEYSKFVSGNISVTLAKRADEFCYNYIMTEEEKAIVKKSYLENNNRRPMVGEYRKYVKSAYNRFFDMLNELINIDRI